jgi:hypothetical protein
MFFRQTQQRLFNSGMVYCCVRRKKNGLIATVRDRDESSQNYCILLRDLVRKQIYKKIIYIYMYMCVCLRVCVCECVYVCVCVCVCARMKC